MRPTGSDDSNSSDSKRAQILAQASDTYARYVASGYDARWKQRPGPRDPMGLERDLILVKAIGDVSKGTIVDLGCGGGHLALTLERWVGRPARYIGIDLLNERIADARDRVPWAEFHVASGDRLPLSDESVDVLVAATLFSSTPDAWFRREIAREIRRILRPDGRVVVYDIRYPSPRNAAVRPIGPKELRDMFPGWKIGIRSVTLLPPLARSVFGRGQRRYRALARIPILRSHLLAVVTRG